MRAIICELINVIDDLWYDNEAAPLKILAYGEMFEHLAFYVIFTVFMISSFLVCYIIVWADNSRKLNDAIASSSGSMSQELNSGLEQLRDFSNELDQYSNNYMYNDYFY